MRSFILAIIFAAACAAQSYTVSMSMEPLDVYRAVFQAQLRQVALYEAVICSGPSEVTVPGGRIMQVANAHGVQTVDRRLLSIAMSSARRKSKLYKAYKVAYYVGWTAALATTGGTVAASDAVKVGILIATQGAGVMKDEMAKRNDAVDLLIPDFLNAKEEISLKAKSCESKMLMGVYDKEFKPFVVEVQ